MRFSTATVFSALMAFAAAYTQPNYNNAPEGNAIYTPSLQEQVPKGVPFDITWDNNLGSKISLVLLRGPSTNVVPIQTIAEDIANTGSYTWTPSASLEVDTTHYGILIVVEGTGAYQWSTQFGIAAGADTSSSSSSSAAAATTTSMTKTTAAPSSTKSTIVTVIDDVTTTYCPEEASSTASVSAATTVSAAATTASAATTQSAAASFSTVWATFESTTTICPETETTAAATTAPATGVPVPPYSTRVPIRSTMLSSAVPSGVAATGTASASPSSTPVFNGAGRNAISFGAIAAAAFAVFAL